MRPNNNYRIGDFFVREIREVRDYLKRIKLSKEDKKPKGNTNHNIKSKKLG